MEAGDRSNAAAASAVAAPRPPPEDACHTPSVQLNAPFMQKNATSFAAAVSSCASTVVGFPLDSIKTRMQTFHYPNVWACVQATRSQEGLGGFFRGLTVPLASITVARTISFSIYDRAKAASLAFLHPTIPYTQRENLVSVPSYFVSGLFAGSIIATLFCPFELTKIASQIDLLVAQTTPGFRESDYRPRGSIRSMQSIVHARGLRGLYSGYAYHVARDALGTACYFSIYECMKRMLAPAGKEPPSWTYAVSGAFCGGLSWVLVFPIDTAKSVFQREVLSGRTPPRLGQVNWLSRVMYRGISVSIARSALINSVNFTIYEEVKKLILSGSFA